MAAAPRAHPSLLAPTHVFMHGSISPIDDARSNVMTMHCVVPQHWQRVVFYRQVYVYTPPTDAAANGDATETSCACESTCACECLRACTCTCTTCDVGVKVDTAERRCEREAALDATLASIALPSTVLCGFCSLDCINAFELDPAMLFYCHSEPAAWRVVGEDADEDEDEGEVEED